MPRNGSNRPNRNRPSLCPISRGSRSPEMFRRRRPCKTPRRKRCPRRRRPMSETVTLWLIPGCPLAAAVIVGLLGRALFARTAHIVVVGALVVSCLLSLFQLGQVAIAASHHSPKKSSAESAATENAAEAHTPTSVPEARGFEWVSIGGLHVEVALRVDALSAVMLAMVTFVSLLVAIYASGYMHGDPGYPRRSEE